IFSAIQGARPSSLHQRHEEVDRPRLLPLGQKQQPSILTSLCFLVTALLPFRAAAQIQQAWVARYNNGITNGTNQAVKMALDSAGNIYVTGSSQNANSSLGYVTMKYAPTGN